MFVIETRRYLFFRINSYNYYGKHKERK